MKKSVMIAMVSAAALTASALDITLTPGSFEGNLSELQSTADSRVALGGTANAADLVRLSEISRKVKTLDLSGLDITDAKLPDAMLLGSSVTDFVWPAGVTAVGNSTFSGSALTSVVVPTSVVSIGDYAFSNCASLVSATITTEAQLGKGIFSHCPSLRTVTFGYELTSVPDEMFDGDSSLETQLPASVESVGAYAYRGTPLQTLDLSNVKTVGDYAFANMPRLETVTMKDGQEVALGTGAFFGDTLLAALQPTNQSALMAAQAGVSGTLTVKSSEVPEAAYANNTGVTSIIFSAGVQKIAANAFRNLTALKTVNVVDLGAAVPEVDAQSFSGLENEEGRYDVDLAIKNDTTNLWASHPVWSLFNIVPGQSGVTNLTAEDINLIIARYGDVVRVNANVPVDFVGLYSLDGMKLYEGAPEATVCEVTLPVASDVVVARVKAGDVVKVVKLTAK